MNLMAVNSLVAEIILINDILVSDAEVYQKIVPQLKNFHFVRLVNADDCTFGLYKAVSSLISQETLFVFPGQGAKDVKRRLEFLDIDFISFINVRTKRYWKSGNRPEVEIKWPELSNIKANRIVVIDDVISSGGTVLALRKNAPDFLQRLPWNLLTWVFKKSSRKILNNESESCFAVFDVKSPSGNMAINSLSTLIKKEEVLTSFAKKHSVCPKKLFKIIKELDS